MYFLRDLHSADIEWLVEAGADPAIQQWSSVGTSLTGPAAQQLIAGSSDDLKVWAIVTEQGQAVGTITLHAIDGINATADVGYWILPQARRQGAARAALQMVEAELKTIPEVQRVQLNIMEGNHASFLLAQGLGYKKKSSGQCSCGNQGEVQSVLYEKTL